MSDLFEKKDRSVISHILSKYKLFDSLPDDNISAS
jgi:hypothetical protein